MSATGMLLLALLATVGSPTAAAAASAAPQDPLFVDATAAAGLAFVHDSGAAGRFYFPEIMGAGGALFDADGDGDLDLYLVQGGPLPPPADPAAAPGDRLFRNQLGESPGTTGPRFVDVTAAAGIRATGYGMGVAAADYDGDGDVDLYVTDFGPNRLLRNDGDGTFSDVTRAAGADDPRWSVPALFFDFDRDGDLDLFVGNYVEVDLVNPKVCLTPGALTTYCSPALFPPQGDRLLRNRGDGTFEEATAALGLDAAFGPALGATAADLDGDGWLDLYVANDGRPNLLWHNQGGRRFVEDALLAGAAVDAEGRSQGSMGVDAEDFDGDGDLDLFLTHLTDENDTLYVNDGTGLFTDRTASAALALPGRRWTGFGTAWLDLDNDGDLDLVVVNGAVKTIEERARAGDPYPFGQPNQIFLNRGGGRFEEVSERGGEAFGLAEVSRGAVVGDIDNDGDLDLVVTNNHGPTRLLLDRVGQEAPWIGLAVLGPAGSDALGAQVSLLRRGAPPLLRRVRTDAGYASANDPRVLFGLGEGPPVAGVSVVWPDGASESWPAPPLRRYTTLRRGTGRPAPREQ